MLKLTLGAKLLDQLGLHKNPETLRDRQTKPPDVNLEMHRVSYPLSSFRSS